MIAAALGVFLWVASLLSVSAETSPREVLAPLIVPPMSLGEPLDDQGLWQLLNSGGAEAGYVFETGPIAPLPGFSGAVTGMDAAMSPGSTSGITWRSPTVSM